MLENQLNTFISKDMARAVARKRGGKRAPMRRAAKKQVRRPRKIVHRKRVVRVRKAPKRKARKMVHRKRAQKRPVKSKKQPAKRRVMTHRKKNVPRASTPVLVKDGNRRKQIVQMVLDEIKRNNGYDLQKRFKDDKGNRGLQNIYLKMTSSASGSYIGNAQVEYEGELVRVFIKMFIADDVRENSNPAFSLLTEACISEEINKDKYSHIPTLMQNYGVLYSTRDVANFYGPIDFNLPTHNKIVRLNRLTTPFHPVYFINELSEEQGSPALTLQQFLQRVPTSLTPEDYIRSLFFNGPGTDSLRLDVYSVFVQLMLTVKIMHEAGLYHNDLHYGNVFVVQTDKPMDVVLGGVTIRTGYLVRMYDWDRGFSGQCNPLNTRDEKFMSLCQSTRDPSNLMAEECYQPHENLPWGDFWMVLYSFALGSARFTDPVYNDEIETRVTDLYNLLTNLPYTGKFWEYNHRINFEEMIRNLKPEHLAQITV